MTATLVGQETDQTTFLGAVGTEPIPEPKGESKPQTTSTQSTITQSTITQSKILCPFCGEFHEESASACPACGQLDNADTRAAAIRRTGLWYVHASSSTANGITFDALLTLIHQHTVHPSSIVRGPGTGQLFRVASTVRGLAREFGQCFSCGGDVDFAETVCPHCDRVQTAQEFPENHSVAPSPVAPPEAQPTTPVAEQARAETAKPEPEEEPLIPEVAGPARAALLGEPTIRVHSLSDHEPQPDEDDDFYVRPVIAQQSERHIPKDDLLTPGELAKAFQLEFSMKADNLDPEYRPYKIPGKTVRQIKVVLAGTGALAIAFLLGMEAIRLIDPAPVRTHRPQVASVIPTPSPATPARTALPVPDAQLASDVAFAPPTPVIKPIDKPATPPIASAPVPPTPSPVAIVTPQPAPAPTPAPIQATAPVQAPAPSPVQPPVAIVTPPPQPVRPAPRTPVVTQTMYIEPTPAPATEDDPKSLLNVGLTAESNGNYAAAIHAYERIQSLPSSQWPANLLTRLELAKKELKGDLQ